MRIFLAIKQGNPTVDGRNWKSRKGVVFVSFETSAVIAERGKMSDVRNERGTSGSHVLE